MRTRARAGASGGTCMLFMASEIPDCICMQLISLGVLEHEDFGGKILDHNQSKHGGPAA